MIRRYGWPAVCMHGDKSQQERDYVLGEFRNGKSSILIATDVAARGLDYIHRIGRTARSESTGTSYAFFTPSNYRQAKDLILVLTEANQVINPKLSEMANRSGSYGDEPYAGPVQEGKGAGMRAGSERMRILVIMAEWTGQHRAFMIEAYFKANDSYTLARRRFCNRFDIRRIADAPSANLVKSWEILVSLYLECMVEIWALVNIIKQLMYTKP
ncbi:hypothetical protein NQ318_022911 [Aromia moschata]|uniref:Helicase C-terminal domain-containing protein n=1 Tax=Aromia moschata TaxID=1265417 RepID=A0AAV8YAY7_9CUCU|nr:hypothetical protein NQ318_022911 [Aromia moschata]